MQPDEVVVLAAQGAEVSLIVEEGSMTAGAVMKVNSVAASASQGTRAARKLAGRVGALVFRPGGSVFLQSDNPAGRNAAEWSPAAQWDASLHG
jgi:hypothetical protein